MESKADWLRSEIEKLEGMRSSKNSRGYNQAITNIITRYKEELKVLESK